MRIFKVLADVKPDDHQKEFNLDTPTMILIIVCKDQGDILQYIPDTCELNKIRVIEIGLAKQMSTSIGVICQEITW